MRILLVEDDPEVGELVKETLEAEAYAVDWVKDGEEALGLALGFPYDLLLLDVSLPRRDGFSLLRVLRGEGSRVPVLMLTARDALEDRVRGLELGADDYLLKPFHLRELRARIRALVRRAKGEATNLVPLPRGYTLDLAAHEVLKDGQTVALTPREYTLIECLGLNPGRAYSRTSLIERVWPEESEVDTKVVDVYVSTVRRKLGENVIETVRGMGYRLGRLEGGGSA